MGPDPSSVSARLPRGSVRRTRRDRLAVGPEERHVHLDRPRHGGRRPSHAVGNRRTHEHDGHREIRRVPVRQGLRQRIRSTLLDRLGLHAVDVLSRTLLSGFTASAAAMRVAVLHDHLRFIGGGEPVALTLAAAFDADLYVTDLDPTLPERAGMPKVRVTEIARVPQTPPMRQDRQARAFREYPIPDHDVYLLSGNWAVFAAPRLRPNTWYCHTPVRVFYDLHDSFLSSLDRVRRWAAQRWIERRRPEYEAAAAAVQTIVANSRNVEARIERFLHRKASVVHPPVDTSRYRFDRVGDTAGPTGLGIPRPGQSGHRSGTTRRDERGVRGEGAIVRSIRVRRSDAGARRESSRSPLNSLLAHECEDELLNRVVEVPFDPWENPRERAPNVAIHVVFIDLLNVRHAEAGVGVV